MPHASTTCPHNRGKASLDEDHREIQKLSRTYLTNYVGDLLITQSGDGTSSASPKLFIVRWDITNSVFNIKAIDRSYSGQGRFEHVTFAPIDIPAR